MASPQQRKDLVQVVLEKDEILEETQQTQAGYHRSDQGQTSAVFSGVRLCNQLSTQEIDHGCKQHQQNKPRLIPTIKDITYTKEEDIPAFGKEVIEEEDKGEKVEKEYVGSKNHLSITV